jgi:hypothetical protein
LGGDKDLVPTSRELLSNLESHLKLRVRLWKDISSLSPLSDTKSPSTFICKSELDYPTWVKRIDIRFDIASIGYFHVEVSDTGAYTIITSTITAGASQSFTVEDITGFQVGKDIILRNASYETDKKVITGITGNTVYFDGYTQYNYTSISNDTVEDTDWYKVCSSWLDPDDPTHTFIFDTYQDQSPMIAVYGKYFRVVSEFLYIAPMTVFDLYEDTYFDLSQYVLDGSPISVSKSVNLESSDAPLTNCSIQLRNDDDRFNRRNPSSPYIDGTLNHLDRLRRITVEYLGCGADWEEGVDGEGNTDWQLLCSFTTRQWQIQYGMFTQATVVGETLHRLTTEVDVPLLEITSTRDLIEDWLLTDQIRMDLDSPAGTATKMRVAILDAQDIERTNTAYRELIGRGNFGDAVDLYDTEDTDPLIYSGFFGICADSRYIYTCHAVQTNDEGDYRSGAVIVKRNMNCLPTGNNQDVQIFYEEFNEYIESGDICICGNYMWLHTAVQGLENDGAFCNVFKIDMTDNPYTLTASYQKKGDWISNWGDYAHLPVHCVSDGTYLYALYNGGISGWRLYKCDPDDYSTIWYHEFSDADVARLGFGLTGLAFFGTGKLMIFTKASVDSTEKTTTADGVDVFLRQKGQYYAIVYDLSDTGTHLIYNKQLSITKITQKQNGTNDDFGMAGVCSVPSGLLLLTGPMMASVNPDKDKAVTKETVQWAIKSASFSRIGKTSFYAQNGKIINTRDEYTDPKAEKQASNYPLEEIRIGGDLQDNGLTPAEGTEVKTWTATYEGTVKHTLDYDIDLETGEITPIEPPTRNSDIVISYDYKPNIQYFTSGTKDVTATKNASPETLPRWETIRKLCEASAGIAFTNAQERVVYRMRRGQEDHIFYSDTAEVAVLRGRHIIHNSNPHFTHNTIQVSNEEHSQFFIEGTHYTISYDAIKGSYTLTEIDNSLDGHIVIAYYTSPADEVVPVFDNTGRGEKPNLLGVSQNSDLGALVNKCVVTGEHKFPSDTPMTVSETYAVSPVTVTIDSKFNKLQLAKPEAQYAWDNEQDTWNLVDNISSGGFVVEYNDPMIIGTPEWTLIEPDTLHVEYQTVTYASTTDDPMTWCFIKWGTAFPLNTTDYDVLLSNNEYWRVCEPKDTESEDWADIWKDIEHDAQWSHWTNQNKLDWENSGKKAKTADFVILKKFRAGGPVASSVCEIYAYGVKSTKFYIDRAGLIKESPITDSENYMATSSPDKRISIQVEPIDNYGNHLFRITDTYDGIVISAEHCMNISAIRLGHDGLQMDCFNYATVENYLKLIVTGYPISTSQIVKVSCEDRIRLDSSVSSMEEQGMKPLSLANAYIQSISMAKNIGYGLLDWLKYPHTQTQVVGKFDDSIELLDVIMIQSDYGHFSQNELWLVVGISHTITDGKREVSNTALSLIDIPDNPSKPVSGS